MSNLYLTSVVAEQASSIASATTSSICYGTARALTINSTAGVTFCNSNGITLGASISSTGVLNCTGLTIGGPLTCTSLIAPNAMNFIGLLTCNTGLSCVGTLNMNSNAISGVTSLTCAMLTISARPYQLYITSIGGGGNGTTAGAGRIGGISYTIVWIFLCCSLWRCI